MSGYGEFDGRGIDWTTFSWQGWVDIGLWLTLISLAYVFNDRISRHASFLVIGFIVIQTGVQVLRNVNKSGLPTEDTMSGLMTVPPALCQLSESRNVFHFILDAFQTDIFVEIVEEEELAAAFDGFTLFAENISTGNQTVLSIPALFSTNIYDGSVRQSQYFRNAISSSFYYVLFQNDYVVNLMPHLMMPARKGMRYFLCPRTYAAPPRIRMTQALAFALDVSMFRQFPHFVKRAVFNDQNWRLSSVVDDPPGHVSFHQKAFFRDYMSMLEVVHTRPAYHFMHLMPPHGPYVTLADGSYAGEALPNTRENYKNEARYILRLFIDFLDRLKDLGLYDTSIVLLHGDHGTGLTAENTPSNMQRQISSVEALLMLKPPSAKGPLQVSKAQTMLTDIPVTILNLLGIQHWYSGESIVNMSDAERRDRHVVFLKDRSAKEPVLHRWIVSGRAADSTSWQQLQTKAVTHRLHTYKWGKSVRFGIAQWGEVYLGTGFSASAGRAWSDGESAEIVFGIKAPDSDVAVSVTFYPFIKPGKVEQQRVRVWANGFLMGEEVFTDGGVKEITTTIPQAELQSDRLVVRFELPDAVAPRDVGAGRDGRELAIALYSFEALLVVNR